MRQKETTVSPQRHGGCPICVTKAGANRWHWACLERQAMGRARFGWLSMGLSTLVLVGCGDGTPPLDELPLRDTLRADPAVVAALDDSARQRLAARFEAAVTEDATSDAVVADRPTPASEVTSLDEARLRRAADALVVGTIGDGVARPVAVGAGAQTPLPQLEGEVATTTAALEARALDGAAGARLRALLAVSGAQRLERVVGWPAGAVAIGETIYVDASWLVALAPVEGGVDGPDAGGRRRVRDRRRRWARAVTPRRPAWRRLRRRSRWPRRRRRSTEEPIHRRHRHRHRHRRRTARASGTPARQAPTAARRRATAATRAAGRLVQRTDDGSDSSCSGTDDGSADACSTPPDDGGDCRVSPGRERPRAATIVWVLAPLGFLIGRRR